MNAGMVPAPASMAPYDSFAPSAPSVAPAPSVTPYGSIASFAPPAAEPARAPAPPPSRMAEAEVVLPPPPPPAALEEEAVVDESEEMAALDMELGDAMADDEVAEKVAEEEAPKRRAAPARKKSKAKAAGRKEKEKKEKKEKAKKPKKFGFEPGFIGIEAMFLCLGTALGYWQLLPLAFVVVLLVLIFVLLPYLYIVLVLRPRTVEDDTTQVAVRREVLRQETKAKWGLRIGCMLVWSLPMTAFLLVLPSILTLVVIPAAATADNVRGVVFGTIGVQVGLIALLQVFSVVRHFKSFAKKKKRHADEYEAARLRGQSFSWSKPSNYITVLVLVFEAVQIISFPTNQVTRLVAESDVGMRTGVSKAVQWVDVIFLDFKQLAGEIGELYESLSLYISAAVVCALVVVLAMQMSLDLMAFWRGIKKGDEKQARETFHHTTAASLIYGHKEAAFPRLGAAIAILSEGFFFAVLSALVRVLSCDYAAQSALAPLGVRIDNGLPCWSPSHRVQAAIALTLYSYYLPLAITIAPSITEADYADDDHEAKDVRFNTSFVMSLSLLKAILWVIPLFLDLDPRSLIGAELLLCVAALAMILTYALRSGMHEPCVLPEANVWRCLAFGGGIVAAGMALLGFESQWPFLLLLPIAVALAMWNFGYRVGNK